MIPNGPKYAFHCLCTAGSLTRQIKGLRGVASVFVVTSHLVRGYAIWLLRPAVEENGYIPWYEWPFIRAYAEGWPWVAVFLILTGFVNTIQPVQKARTGNTDSSLSGLASSAFRRTLRLVLPCTIATFFSWIIAQCGGYNIARMVDSEWMRSSGSAERSQSVLTAITDLLRAIYRTWAWADNDYDRNQWSMTWFLRGTMLLYVTLLATVRVRPRYRMLIFLALFLYSWKNRDTLGGIPIFGGGLLCELSMEPIVSKFSTSRSTVRRALPFSMALVGWYLMSYSGDHTEWAGWSKTLLQIGVNVFPAGAEIASYVHLTGVLVLVTTIVLSSTLQQILSHPVCLWLGIHSFPIYLVHGPLLRSFLNWMLYAFTDPEWIEEKDEDDAVVRIYPKLSIPPLWKFFFAIPIFFVALFVSARLWIIYIEPLCAQFTKWVEDIACGNSRKTENSQEATIAPVEVNDKTDDNENGPLLPV